MSEYSDVFSTYPGDTERTEVVRQRTVTNDTLSIKQTPRRIPVHLREEVDWHTQEMLDRDVKTCTKSKSPWALPVVLAKTKDGTYRYCVDYRRLHGWTHKEDACHLPGIDGCLDSLSGASVFSEIDLYHGIAKWRWTTSTGRRLISRLASSRWCRLAWKMPLLLFRDVYICMHVLRNPAWHMCLMYIDDINIWNKNRTLSPKS